MSYKVVGFNVIKVIAVSLYTGSGRSDVCLSVVGRVIIIWV